MALSRIDGSEELYLGSVFALRRAEALRERNITHILSVIDYSLEKFDELRGRFTHMSVDVDDVDDDDILVHLPRMVRFIEAGLYPSSAGSAASVASKQGEEDAITPAPPETAVPPPGPLPATGTGTGAVYVHCAMGKSRSTTAVIAYLLWKHPSRYGQADRRSPDREEAARAAVARALEWVRRTREMAEPNDGFMRQLAMWWEMGCPADSDDAVESHPVYQRWLYRREVQESARAGRAPDWIRFEDEAAADGAGEGERAQGGRDMRCKKCRRVLATHQFVVAHTQQQQQQQQQQTPKPQPCPHVFVEPLSWMRPALEGGALEGRLSCPNPKCGTSVGRFAWQGFKCSCGEWVCPAISLQRSKVDEVLAVALASSGGAAAAAADQRAALGIRMPPSLRKENL